MTEPSAITLTFEDQGPRARYIATVAGIGDEAELALGKVTDNLWVAIHTIVPDSMQGMGVAKTLVMRLIEDMRAAGRRIVPRCPYVRAQAEKHQEWADVIQW